MNIGFTGTRKGLTTLQDVTVLEILEHFYSDGVQFHHGSCIGADEHAARMASAMGYYTVAYPSDLPDKYQSKFVSDFTWTPEPPLQRNRAIIEVSEYMICCPKDYLLPESLRGQGTWWTIVKCDKLMHPMVTVYPDGKYNEKWIASPGCHGRQRSERRSPWKLGLDLRRAGE